VALAFFVIVISEFIGAEQGLGFLIQRRDATSSWCPQMLGGRRWCWGCLGYAGNALVRLLERR
jgi:ABC-type nitrate/sulfonate/bicarbonate transport system permease component